MYSDLCVDWLGQQRNFTQANYNIYFTLAIFNGLFSIVSVIGNLLVIVAVKKSSSLKSPSFVLLTNLAMSDLGVGLFVQPMYIVYKVSELNSWLNIHCYIAAAYYYAAIIFVFVSFGTICFISFDRYLAVSLGIRYRIYLQLNRVKVAIAGLWLVSISLGGLYFINVLAYFFAELFFIKISLLLTTFLYLTIVRKLSKRQLLTPGQTRLEEGAIKRRSTTLDNRARLDAARYKRSVYSMLSVYAAFILCYTPFFGFRIMLLILGRNTAVQAASNITLTIVFMNSSLNPFLYYWRIPEIRRAVRSLMGLLSEDSISTEQAPSSAGAQSPQKQPSF